MATGGSDTERGGGGERATGGSVIGRGGGGESATGGSVIGRGGGGERATGGSTLGSDIGKKTVGALDGSGFLTRDSRRAEQVVEWDTCSSPTGEGQRTHKFAPGEICRHSTAYMVCSLGRSSSVNGIL